MNTQIMRWALTLVILAIGTTTLGQTGGQYDLGRSTIDGGGATSTGGPYVISGTIGQPDAGWMAGGNYELLGGFWSGGPLCFVDFHHFARFAEYWLETGTGLPADLYEDDIVNWLDLGIFVDEWLGCCPRGWPLAYDQYSGIPMNGLVAYWSFDEGSGTTAHDSVADNDGNLVGEPNWVDGVSGKALSFNGSSDYVRVPYDDALQFSGVTSHQSISFWMNINDYDGYYSVLENKDNYLVYIQSDGRLRYAQSDSGNLYHRTFSVNILMPLSQWNHIVITYDGTDQASSTEFHVNGTINSNVYTGQHSGWSAGNGDFVIGAELAGGLQAFFKGKIDEVLIYNRVLTSTEIEYLYQNP